MCGNSWDTRTLPTTSYSYETSHDDGRERQGKPHAGAGDAARVAVDLVRDPERAIAGGLAAGGRHVLSTSAPCPLSEKQHSRKAL